jgi:hypothetical protein
VYLMFVLMDRGVMGQVEKHWRFEGVGGLGYMAQFCLRKTVLS